LNLTAGGLADLCIARARPLQIERHLMNADRLPLPNK
jgi:hypothetical protein